MLAWTSLLCVCPCVRARVRVCARVNICVRSCRRRCGHCSASTCSPPTLPRSPPSPLARAGAQPHPTTHTHRNTLGRARARARFVGAKRAFARIRARQGAPANPCTGQTQKGRHRHLCALARAGAGQAPGGEAAAYTGPLTPPAPPPPPLPSSIGSLHIRARTTRVLRLRELGSESPLSVGQVRRASCWRRRRCAACSSPSPPCPPPRRGRPRIRTPPPFASISILHTHRLQRRARVRARAWDRGDAQHIAQMSPRAAHRARDRSAPWTA